MAVAVCVRDEGQANLGVGVVGGERGIINSVGERERAGGVGVFDGGPEILFGGGEVGGVNANRVESARGGGSVEIERLIAGVGEGDGELAKIFIGGAQDQG